MLNAQPLGFYAPAQLVRDARDHGVMVRPVDVNFSGWHALLEGLDGAATLTEEGGNARAVRLGFHQIKGFREEAAEVIVSARPSGGFDSVRDLWLRTRLAPSVLERLAQADCFRSLGLDRRAALWAVKALGDHPLPLLVDPATRGEEAEVKLPSMPLGEHVVHDYAHLRLSLKAHPLSFLRAAFDKRGILPNGKLSETPDGKRVTVAGLVLVRQRPGSASGVIFATLEDETGVANIVIWPKTFETYRKVVLAGRIFGVRGRVQKEGLVIHVVAEHIEDLTYELGRLSEAHGTMDDTLGRGDAFKHPPRDPDAVAEENARMKADRQAKILPKSRDFH